MLDPRQPRERRPEGRFRRRPPPARSGIRNFGVRWLLQTASLCTALGCLGLGGVLRAEPQWQAKRILLEPPAGAADAAGEFVFFNRGTSPIRVVDARSSCDCTVMAMEKSVVPPGEKGSIPFVFHVGSRQGRQSVIVVVTTNEPEVRTYELTVEVAIKDFAVLTPRLLYWKLGDDPAVKILQVSLVSDFRFVGAESASPDFSVEVAGRTDGAVQLRVTPRDTWAKRNGLIKVKVAQGRQLPVEIMAHLRVQ